MNFFSVIEISHIIILPFKITEKKRCKRPEVKELEKKLEESFVTGLLRFSMGKRQDDSKEKTWRIER